MGGGIFITFEGGEGAGKTTQIKFLDKVLRSDGHDVVLTREPGGTPAAEEIRNLLSHAQYGGKWTPEAELLLLFAARAMHLNETIRPALEVGKIVLCDRFIHSTRVYQGHLQGLDFALIEGLEKKIVGPTMPDMTFIFDLAPGVAMERVAARGAVDHYDMGDLEFYTALHRGFMAEAQDDPDHCHVIDAARAPEEISDTIYRAVREKLDAHAV
jgi:dTMP kinase